MEELQKLYDVLVREGKYSKSFDEFQSKWSKDQAYKDKVYGVVTRDGLYSKDKDSFLRKYTASQPIVKKKDSSESNIPQPQKTSTTVLPSADGSLATQKPTNVSVPVGGGYSPLAIPAFLSEATKTVYQFADDALVSARKSLQEEGFFDDDIPDTDTPISDAVKKKIVSIDPKYSKPQNDGVLNPAPYIKSAANLGLKIINSTLPQDKKNVIIAALNLGDATLKRNLKDIDKIQEYALPKDNVAVNVGKGMVGMAPDLLLARAMGNPAASEGRLAKFATEVTKDAKPLLQKYVPKAAKFIEESIRAPFTKIMGGKGVVSGIANAKEGEDIVEAGVEGGLEGTAEGMYMHALGVAAGKTMPAIAKQISKTGLNSAWSTGIANPLANAGVFATAKAIRTPIETGELATEEELLTELGTGVGFSLLHAGSLAKNHNELNHYADNVLKTDEIESFKRVANETKDNLDLVYNPDLTPENISELETARDELKSAIIKEPDLQNKQLLINEALKIQNQLDANSAINNIVKNKNEIVNEINSNPDTSEDVKEFYTKKIQAIADYFDNSEFGIKKKELNTRIEVVQKELDDASLAYTNRKSASDGIEADIQIKERKAELEDLNNQLTELITNKVKENAVQEQSTTEIPVQPETGISKTVEEGISEPKPEVVTEQVKQEEVKKPSIVVHATADERGFALNYSEGIEESNITSPEDVRDFKRTATDEQKTEFGKGKAVITIDEVAENGDKNISFVSEISDPTGRAGGTVFDFVIPKGNEASAEGIKNIYDEVSKGLKGKELVNETVKQIKQYIDSNKPTEGPPPMPEGFDVFAEPKLTEEVVIEEPVIIEKQKSLEPNEEVVVETKPAQTIEQAIKTLQESKEYAEADDIQKENLVRATRKEFGLKEKAAPSVNRLFGKLKDIAKVTMTEKAALVKQIKDLARGAKDAKIAIKNATKDLAAQVGELRKGGKITTAQEKAVLNKFSNVNVFSETSVSRFTDYMTKVFENAEYSNELSNAKKSKTKISKLSRNKEKNASLKELGKEFSKIDPSMVDDIYQYNDMASKIEEALKGSTIRGQKVNFANTVEINEAIDFTNKAIESQNKKLREERIAELQDLLGVDAKDFSAEEIDALLKGEKPISKDNEKIVRASINKAFKIYSSIVKDTMWIGKDSFTGEKINLTKNQKDLVGRFMDMDLNLLDPKEALSAVDALQNFLVNKSTAKMDAVVNEYQGIKNIKELTNKGLKSRELTKLGSKILGRQLADKVTSLPVMFEKMFPGLSRSGEVMDKIGLTNLFNKRSEGLTEGNNIVDNFVEKFYNKKANGEDYNTAYNITERALAAHAIRSLIGTEEQIQKEFNDRKSLIEQSITELSKGNDKEKKLSELYKKAYDKILKDSNNADEVLSKTDSNNKEGVNFWIEEYAKKYDQSADVSENIYNTKLDRDLNYTPMKYSKLSTDSKEVELDNDQSSFHNNNGSIIVPKTGSLNEIQRLSELPKGKYVDLSFDKNMSNSMYDLITDINTAGPIRQIKAAINSPEFDKLVPYAEDRSLLKGGKNKMGRIELYVKNIRNKSPYSTSEDMKALNRIAAIGVGQALAGVTQPLKQTIPVAISTFINTKGKLQLGATFNPDKLAFIDNSGYSIANRGRQSQAEIEAVNRLIEKSEGSLGSKTIKYIEKANELQLKYLLEKPDSYIAKAAWITYYEEALRKQGVNTEEIDYSKHKLNEDAANYAQRQVDRQQNISDKDLAGRLYTDKNNYAQLITKMLMPFSSFRMNASAKFGADMITLKDKTASKEDKAIARRSIAGYAAEMAVFRAISVGSALLIGSLVNKYLDKDESDEDFEKRRDNLIKGAATGTFTDLFSPVPVLDPFVQQIGAKATEGIDELTGTNIAIYDVKKQEFLKEYGTLGISLDRLGKLWDLGNLAATGKYKDDFGKEKEISEKDRMALVPLVPLSLATDLGLAPTEINSAINNAVKFAKKGGGSGGISKEELKKKRPEIYKRIYGNN
jgi:hypothetical protein